MGMTWDISGWEAKLDQLLEPEAIHSSFGHLLLGVYEAADAKVHVITGRLKASGHTEVETDDKGTWIGTVVFDATILPYVTVTGEPHTNKWTGQSYAWFEQRRGGPHDFLSGAEPVMAVGMEILIQEFLAV